MKLIASDVFRLRFRLFIVFQMLVDFFCPIRPVGRTEGANAELAGRCHIAWAVVNEEGFAGQDVLFGENMHEETGVGLHELHLEAFIFGIEIGGERIALAVELVALCPAHHERIGV